MSKPSWQQWNVSPNRIRTLKNSYGKRTPLWVPKGKIKKVPVPSEETKRGPKVVMPQADPSDKI